MSTEFDASNEPDIEEEDELRYVGLYNGTVADNKDPEELGRVKITIPGLIEPASAWALPLGTLGGGGPQRGFFSPPAIDADVFVLFLQGDVDAPCYWSGHWGVPDAGKETPGPTGLLGAAERPKVAAFETERFLTVWDNRDGNEVWFVIDKVTNDQFRLAVDGITIKSSQNVDVNGSQILLNGSIPVGRVGDSVAVTIPPGTVLVTGPLGPIPNPAPIPLTGTITSGSGSVKAG